MNIERLEVGQMKANCYLVSDNNSETIIIDPGDDAEYIISVIQRNNLNPRLILATHGHIDHVMAIFELKLAFNIPFYMHQKDLFLLKKMKESALHFLKFDPGPIPDVDLFIDNKSKIEVGELNLEVIHTPGHTPGSVCYFDNDSNLFVGDLIFKNNQKGRTDFSYSNKLDYEKSVRLITQFPSNVLVHPGHDDQFEIGSLTGTS